MQAEFTILGAGVAGLAVATALAQRGRSVRVVEQAEAIREVGAGLQISPNGARVLRALGLGKELAAAGPLASAVLLRDFRRGRDVFRLPLSRADRPYHLLHRADLIGILQRGAKAAGVRFDLGQAVSHVALDVAPELHFADGRIEQPPFLIGADGLHSLTRAALNAAARPFFTGQVAWRALLPSDDPGAPAEPTVFMGPGRHLVRYPLRGGALTNIVAVEERDNWAVEGWQHRDKPRHMQAAFCDFCPEVRDLLARVEECYLWGLFRHPVAKVWVGPQAAILGDAAHPTLPFLAQGANMALEDAWALAASIDSAEGLARYQAKRRARTAKIVEAASRNAENYHLNPGPYRAMAHLALRVGGRLAPGVATRQFEWLYGYDVTRDFPT